jgi:hypothetical protein
MLTNCNALSQNRLKNVTEDYKKHCKLLIDMKKDLEYIYKKIRTIKGKLEVKYPQSFEQVSQRQAIDEEDNEREAEENIDYEQLESIKLENAQEAT